MKPGSPMSLLILYALSLVLPALRLDAASAGAGNLVAHWRFNETAGPTASDSTGNFPGVLSPAGATFVAGGISGNAIQIDNASNGYIELGDVLANVDSSYSISIWFKLPPGDVTPVGGLFSRHQPGFENGYYIVVNDFPNTISAYSGTIPFLGTTAIVNDGQWHHLVLSHQLLGVVRLFLDGALVDSTSLPATVRPSPAQALMGGFDFGFPVGSYNGLLDEVQVYDFALDANHVGYLFGHPGSYVGKPPSALTIVPNGGNFVTSVNVSLRTTVPGGEIRYTTDGSPPQSSSLLYAAPFVISDSTRVRARVFVNGHQASPPENAVFNKIDRPELRGRLLAHWQFNESAGSVAADATGDYPGTLSPTGAAFVPNGISGNAIELDRNSNGFVALGNVLPNTGVSYSIALWFKIATGDLTPVAALFSKHQPGFENGYFIILNNFPDTLAAYTGAVPFLSTTDPIDDGQWHHAVLAYELGGSSRLFLDGAPAEATAASGTVLPSVAQTLLGGLDYGPPQGAYSGKLDEVQVYDFPLNDDEVDYLYLNPGAALGLPMPALQILPDGGTFAQSVTVRLKTSVPGGEIRYTINGSAPSPNSPLYTGPLTINSPTALKARVFVNGKLASQMETAKFIPVPEPKPRGNLLAHWAFDESSGNTAADATGTYPGTLSPSGASFVSGGISGNALELSRAGNGYVALGDILPQLNTSYSVSLWFQMIAGDTTPVGVLLARHQPGYENGYFIIVNNFPDTVAAYTGNIPFLGTTATVNDGLWHHVVLSYDVTGQILLYLDGSPARSMTAAVPVIPSPAQTLIGGLDVGAPIGAYDGRIDEVQVYDFPLTDQEVDYLFANPSVTLGGSGNGSN